MTVTSTNVNKTNLLSVGMCVYAAIDLAIVDIVDSTSILPCKNNVQMVFCHRFMFICAFFSLFLSSIFNCSVHALTYQPIFFPLHTYTQ